MMPLPKAVRDSAFNLARRDLAVFLEEHEADLVAIFREEMQHLDDELPEEAVFIDLDLVGIGDMILKATLHALRRFLLEVPEKPHRAAGGVQPVENVSFWRRKSQ
jgi:hypothetical protein